MIKKESYISVIGILVIWQLISLLLNNDILLPSPISVVTHMIIQLSNPLFFKSILNTLLRVIYGVSISLIIAGILGVTSALSDKMNAYFTPINLIIKTIPNITYIIISLIWLGPEKSVVLIVFFILFPTFYSDFYYKASNIKSETKDLLMIYPISKKELIRKIYLPQLLVSSIQSIKVGFGLGFKIAVMAEILGQVKAGVGRQMNFAKLNLDTTSIFAWTVWIIIISWLITVVLNKIEGKIEK